MLSRWGGCRGRSEAGLQRGEGMRAQSRAEKAFTPWLKNAERKRKQVRSKARHLGAPLKIRDLEQGPCGEATVDLPGGQGAGMSWW